MQSQTAQAAPVEAGSPSEITMVEPIEILLVDDEPRNLDALEAILSDPGYRLIRAGDAEKALRLLLEHDVAAIVLDIKMPGISGFELAQLIKGTKRFRQIPIVFLTAYHVDDTDIVAGYGAGAVDYLTKPVNPQILRHKIAVFAELFRKSRALAELNMTLEARVHERTAELERSEGALREADKKKDAFLATLAHELRNPLAPLRTGMHLLRQIGGEPAPGTAEDAVFKKTLAAMNRQVDHMVRLIDDLLDVSRVSRGMLELKKAPAELQTVLENAIETAKPTTDQRKLAITLRTTEAIHAMVDATRVCQVVANLLNNAAKFTPVGGRIALELLRDGPNAIIKVIDEGVGIPHDQIERVFDMFTKIERVSGSSTDGLGIGLALSRRLAELHGGTLTAASEGEGKGATFTLTLPTGDMTVASYEPRPTNSSNGASLPLSIVVVEDNADAGDMLVLWLERMGHEVQLARTGPEGLDLVVTSKPDVVLCDLGLPGIDGVEVCRQARATMSVSPVMVALTGWGMEADRRRTVEVGFEHHLVKPVGLDDLTQVLRGIRPRS